ncbi:MAG: PAP/fibrillin family protein [Tolypothrix carrinoi HA7290-LM1]|nr:PAP/fibrillin family protein [Tolypothrix carrinoi HA7290-LM1]
MVSVLANLKKELISISTATDIGFNSTLTIKQQIETLAESLEVLNPTVEPTSFMELVQGRWQLLYSTFGLERETTLQRLSFGKLPNVTVNVTGIFQEVYLDGQQYINLIEFTVGSDVKGIAAVTGRYRVEDSKRLNIDFLETSVKSASNDLDVSTFRSCLGIDSQSALESKLDFSGWSDITYLDENLRLMRGNNQNLYVLVRTN